MGETVSHRQTATGQAPVWRPIRWLAVAACAGLVAACSSGHSRAPVGVATTTTTTETSSASVSAPPTVASSTSSATTTAASTSVVTTTAAPPTAVSTTQPAATTTADPDVRSVSPDDLPIVDAYKAYISVFNQAATSNPVNAGVDFSQVAIPSFATTIRNYLAGQRDKGAVLNVSLGVTLRPFVVTAPRTSTEAYVNDCQLDGSYWMDAAGNPLPGERAVVRRNGVLFKMTLIGGTWVVATGGKQGGACIGS